MIRQDNTFMPFLRKRMKVEITTFVISECIYTEPIIMPKLLELLNCLEKIINVCTYIYIAQHHFSGFSCKMNDYINQCMQSSASRSVYLVMHCLSMSRNETQRLYVLTGTFTRISILNSNRSPIIYKCACFPAHT